MRNNSEFAFEARISMMCQLASDFPKPQSLVANTYFMANTSSAKKANRVEMRRRVFNARRSKAMKDAVKEMLKGGDASKIPMTYQAIDKALKRGIIKKNTAARMKSRVAHRSAVK